MAFLIGNAAVEIASEPCSRANGEQSLEAHSRKMLASLAPEEAAARARARSHDFSALSL